MRNDNVKNAVAMLFKSGCGVTIPLCDGTANFPLSNKNGGKLYEWRARIVRDKLGQNRTTDGLATSGAIGQHQS